MTEWRIPLYRIYWDDDELQSVSEVIRRGMFWTGGPSVQEFESKVAKLSKRKYAVAFNSGTSGQQAILMALGIGAGNEIIVPSFTFISTCNTVLHVGAKPVFSEIESKSFGLDPQDIKSRITSKTKAIVPVHYAGGSCQIKELREIAEDHDLFLVEDAAESFGSEYNGSPVGSFGIAAMYSFCGNKVLTTGEGGMVVTDDEDLAQSLRLVRSHGRTDRGNYFSSSKSFDYVTLGYNWRMSDITAELGRSQLRKFPTLVKKRRKIAGMYNDLLKSLPLVTPRPIPKSTHVYQMYTIMLESLVMRERMRKALTQKLIMTKVYFDCVHLTSYYLSAVGTEEGNLPVTENISSRVLTIPIYPDMSEDDVHYVCDAIHEVAK